MGTGTPPNQYAGFDAKVISDLRWAARRLAGKAVVAGMDIEDYEQELIIDLWRRQSRFDPSKASFRTFANRVVSHRASTLSAPTIARRAERNTISWDALVENIDLNQLIDDLPDNPSDGLIEDKDLGIDVRRFFGRLSPAMQRICAAMLGESVSEGARLAGLHRSSVYEALPRLRAQAAEAGLDEYVAGPRQFGGDAGK